MVRVPQSCDFAIVGRVWCFFDLHAHCHQVRVPYILIANRLSNSQQKRIYISKAEKGTLPEVSETETLDSAFAYVPPLVGTISSYLTSLPFAAQRKTMMMKNRAMSILSMGESYLLLPRRYLRYSGTNLRRARSRSSLPLRLLFPSPTTARIYRNSSSDLQ